MIAALGTVLYVAVLLAVAKRVAGRPEERELIRDTGQRAHPEQVRRVEAGAMSRRRVAVATPIVLLGTLAGLAVAPAVAGGGWGAVLSTVLLLWPLVRLRQWWLRTPGESSLVEEALACSRERFGRGLDAALVASALLLVALAFVNVPLGALVALLPTLALLAPTLPLARNRHRAYKSLERALAGTLTAPGVPVGLGVAWAPGSAEWTALGLLLPEGHDPARDPFVIETLRARVGERAQVVVDHHERRIDILPAAAPLPAQVEWDATEAPDGLALTLGLARNVDTEEPEEVVWDPDAADPHLLVTGPTRSGKSVLLRCLLAQALAGRWQVVIADPKGVDYRWADGLPGVERHSGDDAFEAIDAAVEEMRERQVWMEEHAPATAANLGEVPDNPFRPLLLISDETAELLELGGDGEPKERKQRTDQTRQGLGSLARRSRFVSVVMCVATQRPDATVIGGEVRGNLGTRVLTGEGEQQHKLMAFGTAEVEPLPPDFPNGRARVAVGGGTPREMQVPWISAEDVLAAHEAPDDRAENTVPAAWEQQHSEADDEGRVTLDLDDDEEEPA